MILLKAPENIIFLTPFAYQGVRNVRFSDVFRKKKLKIKVFKLRSISIELHSLMDLIFKRKKKLYSEKMKDYVSRKENLEKK